jgi:hemerythrin-like domain-containing protein
MEPIGPLMWEHRTIERAVGLLRKELGKIRGGGKPAPEFLEITVDFFRTYADRTHHGKEEDILFRELARKRLSPELSRTMDELKAEHVRGRALVGRIDDFAKSGSDPDSLLVVLEELAELYPRHIEKEDKHFFYPVLDYFSREERDNMLREFYDFDRQLIHEKYKALLEQMGDVR